jgi:hypothetical protein
LDRIPLDFPYIFLTKTLPQFAENVQVRSTSTMPQGVTDLNYMPLPGSLDNLTISEQHALDKFKKELQDEGVFVKERMDDATHLWSVSLAPIFLS